MKNRAKKGVRTPLVAYLPRFEHLYALVFRNQKNGGEWGIRTPGTLRFTRFPSVRHRPLDQLSKKNLLHPKDRGDLKV